MKYFSNIYGLVTKTDPTTENGGLFFAEYLTLKKIRKEGFTERDVELYNLKMSLAKVSEGLYKRSANHNERTVSQDEHTGFSVASYIFNNEYRFLIWNYLVKHFLNYPATGVNKWYNFGSYYSWAILAQSKISLIFAPLYTINLLISTNKPKNNTSSKLIYLTELFSMKEESKYSAYLWAYYIWRMKKMYGNLWIEELFNIYFGSDSENPLINLSRGIHVYFQPNDKQDSN